MHLEIREINKKSREELKVVTERCMAAVLETIPEFQGSDAIARSVLPNFSFEQMAEMIRNDFSDPTKRIMLAVYNEKVVGQALYSIKQDEKGESYGFCFSRYVIPSYRRIGVASALLTDAINWFLAEGAVYVYAQTHVTNIQLQHLFKKFGFTLEGPFQGNWEYYILRKELNHSHRQVA